jgi:hypothetical protein
VAAQELALMLRAVLPELLIPVVAVAVVVIILV